MNRFVVLRSAARMMMITTQVVLAGVAAVVMSTPRVMYGSSQVVATASGTEIASASDQLLARPVTVDLDRVSLKRALNAVGARAGVQMLYQAELINAYTVPVSLHAKATPLRVVVAQILASTPLQAVPVGGTRIMIVEDPRSTSRHMQGTITGTVTDAQTKRPLSGAKISVHGVDRAVTDERGMYRIAGIDAGTHSVTVKMLGYGKRVQAVTVADGSVTTVDVMLEPSANALDQVVVTGTVIPTELKAMPSAITVITAKQIEERGITKIDQLFRGDVPGVFVPNVGANAFLDEVTMFSRGATALAVQSVGSASATDPLTNPIKTYVDGVELADPKYLSQVDPKSIERIEILTGPQASTIYGSNAINGVMQIFTKRGTSNTPQLTLNLLSGFVQNNFSSALTPQHDYSAQLSGIEGRISYNAGASWNYVGPWTPAKQTARTGGFGGTRLDLSTPAGRVTTDLTLRRSITQNLNRGNAYQTWINYGATGWYTLSSNTSGHSAAQTNTLTGQTLGLALTYAPARWWSHDLGWGNDVSDVENRNTVPGNNAPRDTTLFVYQSHTAKPSLHYATTARLPLASLGQATITAGADARQSVTSTMSVSPQTLTGQLVGFTSISRQPNHNTGGFLQMQFGVDDRFFLTYGLRAEWNPGFGAEALPNYAPRYGVVYTQELGSITAKLRGSYGRSTRPPQTGWKAGQTILQVNPDASSLASSYGNFDLYLANPDLAPEHQQGGEGGVELYLGTRASLVITWYNQTVDGLIDAPQVDSARSLAPNPSDYWTNLDANGYGYWPQFQYLNLGTIRNQGWEMQWSMNLGPFATRGTYSWTKSRTIGVNPKYRAQFASQPQYQPGATFRYLPEHTWTLGVTYARASSLVELNLTGTGRVTNVNDRTFLQSLSRKIRLAQNRLNFAADNAPSPYVDFNKGYALADLVASHRFASRVEGVLQVQNLTNHYTNDYDDSIAILGRQVSVGARIRTR